MNQTGVDIPFVNTDLDGNVIPYSFSIPTFEQKLLSFDLLTVNLQDFAIEPIEMGQQPAGMDEYELPTLQFNLTSYSQIKAPLIIDLILTGITTDPDGSVQSKEANVELIIEYFEGYDDLDALANITEISLQDTKAYITRPDGTILENEIKDSEDNPVSLFEIFTYENIQVDGTPKLEGTGTLTPGAGFWMDFNPRSGRNPIRK